MKQLNTKARRKSPVKIDHRQRKKNYTSAITLIKRKVSEARAIPMPVNISPMLATLAKAPFDDKDWLFEIKWDGYRSLAFMSDGKVELRSRNNLSFNDVYKPVVEALADWGINAVIDGEVVVLNAEGKADFEALQNYKRRRGATLVYYVFDILWLDGISLMEEPLYRRKEILQSLLPEGPVIKYSDSIEEFGKQFFEVARANELEGIVAKKKNSLYVPGERTKNWLKMPTAVRQEFVIGGWTESDSAREFKSLLFGYYTNEGFVYVGHAGGGFKDREMKSIKQMLTPLETKRKPFVNEVDTDRTVHWVKPKLVAEIKYASFTSSGKIRKPAIFLGFRKDKNPSDVKKEVEIPGDERERISIKTPDSKKEKLATSPDSNWPVIEHQKITSKTIYHFEGKEVALTNIEKPLWGDFTKAHLLMYYHSVYPHIIKYLRDRPLSLHIKHLAPTAPGMYIKDMEGRQPEWAHLFQVNRKHRKKGKRDVIDYIVCNDEATLQWLVNLGCIDLNPWTSRVDSPDTPDYIIIDLDPSDDDFTKAVETAMAAKELFDSKKIRAFPKTSGKTGMHLYLPCSGFDFSEARSIAENIAEEIHSLVPSITTTSVSVSSRGDKLYIDPNQNDYADTVAAPYSVRPFHLPTVSTPLEWKEVKPGLDSKKFTVETILERLKKKGDLFAKVHNIRIASGNNNNLALYL